MRKPLIIHPFLFAIFPVLFLFVHNIDQFHARMIVGPAVAIVCVALFSWALLSLLLKDRKRAGLIVSLFFLLFFSYAVCHFEVTALMAALPGRHAVGTAEQVLVLWAILFALGAYAFAKTRRNLDNLTTMANVVAGCLVLISLINSGPYLLRRSGGGVDLGAMRSPQATSVEDKEPGTLPDIYYIILDGYARADVLEEIYDYDNDDFLDYLTGKGFYVAHESRSNYCQTVLSLASSLNMMYLDGLVEQIGAEYQGPGPAGSMISDSAAIRFLKRYDYEIIAFASGYPGTEIRNADTYLAARWYPDVFQVGLINMTPIPVVANAFYDMHALHRERILYAFHHVADATESTRPVFVFAHIMAPHPPFVFGQYGHEIDPEHQFAISDGSHLIGELGFTRDDHVSRYREQLTFINAKVKEAVDEILSRSSRQAIVILQGDHGPGSMLNWEDPDSTNFKERLSILNVYYLPNHGHVHLYDDISPVSTFRLVLNHYFGTDYELLQDESYFSTAARPYAFINVTDEMNANVGMEDLE